MLQLSIQGGELFDEENLKVITVRPHTLQLEHSLVSISKWEAKWKKPFMQPEPMTRQETLDYIRCMTVSPQNVDSRIYQFIRDEHVKKVMDYIHDPMTATTISNRPGQRSGGQQVLTSELIYYYMSAYQIPYDPCQKWHFNRLMTLIRVCDEKQQKPRKMSKAEIANRNRQRNAARKARLGTRG